jgi:hypothetical protein
LATVRFRDHTEIAEKKGGVELSGKAALTSGAALGAPPERITAAPPDAISLRLYFNFAAAA